MKKGKEEEEHKEEATILPKEWGRKEKEGKVDGTKTNKLCKTLWNCLNA